MRETRTGHKAIVVGEPLFGGVTDFEGHEHGRAYPSNAWAIAVVHLPWKPVIFVTFL